MKTTASIALTHSQETAAYLALALRKCADRLTEATKAESINQLIGRVLDEDAKVTAIAEDIRSMIRMARRAQETV